MADCYWRCVAGCGFADAVIWPLAVGGLQQPAIDSSIVVWYADLMTGDGPIVVVFGNGW